MAKKIGQMRCNIASDPSSEKDIFTISKNKISKIGVQAPPGTVIYIDETKIMVGLSGLYELDNPGINVSKITCDRTKAPIIIDYVYDES